MYFESLSKIKYFLYLISVHITHQAGPVYVNPNAPQVAQEVEPTSVVKDNNNFVTQTVYGFLDFTTTIGNTIMVFSPQSAAAPGLFN